MSCVRPINPLRKKWSLNLPKDIQHAKKMARNPDDTQSVYHIRDALRTSAFYKHVESFLNSEIGQKIYDQENDLADVLDDTKRLSNMPKNTVGYIYWHNMMTQSLSAKDLKADYQIVALTRPDYNDRVDWYLERQCDTHDLMHVLTGYGCDNLGEQCLLGFSDSQCPSLGALFIAYVGGFLTGRKLPKGVQSFRSINEGRRNGRKAKIIAHQMISDILPMPLDQAQKMLNISKPILYQNNLLKIQGDGIDPFDILGNNS